MESGLLPFIGRLLVIPVALSGVCVSMVFGVPMAEAMTMNDSHGHGMIVIENQDQESQSACCATVQMEHDTEATTPSPEKTLAISFVAVIPPEISAWEPDDTESAWISSDRRSLHQQFSLTGIIFKRE